MRRNPKSKRMSFAQVVRVLEDNSVQPVEIEGKKYYIFKFAEKGKVYTKKVRVF
jgi:hypothetical protein